LTQLIEGQLTVGSKLEYTIVNQSLQGVSDPERLTFQHYLVLINLLLVLASVGNIAGLQPVFAYFSPYRSAGPQDLRANLSADSFQSQLSHYANSSSHAPSSLLRLATFFFGELRRGMEVRAHQEGYLSLWTNSSEVRKVTEYLDQLGYIWSVSVIDERKNVYQIDLRRGNRTFSIEQASSGEKEILTLVLGIFALRTSGGLIIIDEPEVHLHPRWQSTLRAMLIQLSEETGNQIVLSTHSPVFINPSTIQYVRRIYSTNPGETRVTNVLAGSSATGPEKDAWHILNSHNNERVFFADRVVLVEGIQDRILLEAVFAVASKAINSQRVVEFVEVHGKSNFTTYAQLLTQIEADFRIVADLDYAANIGSPDVAALFVTNFKAVDKSVLLSKSSEDRVTLAELMETAIGEQDVSDLAEFWKYITGRFRSLKAGRSAGEEEKLQAFLVSKSDEGIHLLRHEQIEDYLPTHAQSVSGTIELVSPGTLEAWLLDTWTSDTTQELMRICGWILDVEQESLEPFLARVRASLNTVEGGAD
jgi:hypothetical protein